MNWLITGGCGFIGRSLIKDLVDEDCHRILVVDNLSVGSREDLGCVCDFEEIAPLSPVSSESPPGVTLVVGDVLDEPLALWAACGRNVIVHLAANTGVPSSVDDPRKDCITNVIGTLNYLEAARHHRTGRFVFASSGAPIGECKPPIHEEIAPHPISPYGASKLAGEGYCSAYYRTFGIETVALRFGNVYGPHSSRKESVVARFIKHALEKKPLEIYGDGTQTRDFIYVEDLVQAIRSAAESSGIGGEVFQIASASELSIGELAEKIIAELKSQGVAGIEIRYLSPRVGDAKRNCSDTSKAEERLGWKCRTDINRGLKKTTEWFLRS